MRTTHQPSDPFRRGRVGLSRADVLAMIFCGTLLPLLTMAWIGCDRPLGPLGLSGPTEVEQRQQCKDRLKNLGLGMHRHHAADQFLPPGSTSRASWPAYLLPHIDQQGVYSAPECNPRVGTEPVVVAGTINDIQIDLFLCPANLKDPPQHDGELMYLGVSGLISPRAAVDAAKRGVFRDETYDMQTGERKTDVEQPMSSKYLGWSQRGNYFRFRDCTDGTSNTLMLGETTRGGIKWAAPYDPDGNTTLAWMSGPSDHINAGGSFSSKHPGGAQFVTIDGFVAFINEKVDPGVFAACLTIRGGEDQKLPQ